MPVSKAFPLHTVIQNYAWGKKGHQSEVAALIKNVCPHFDIDEGKPYAELWMGTHPSGPSFAMLPGGKIGPLLSDVLKDNPEMLGEQIPLRFGLDLPYLFKVLSVNTALSIQAHPDKVLAEELHRTKPDLYKDPNHKPELALALTPFEVLCGFRPYDEICGFLNTVPEFAHLVGASNAEEMHGNLQNDEASHKIALKKAFTSVMTAETSQMTEQLSRLIERASAVDDVQGEKMQKQLLQRIYKDFPGDVGCFGIYFLNYLQLQPGEAVFLGANEPHAYLYGDCVEIMACSDNTVRAGLTPKFIDVQILCEMLTYKCTSAKSRLFQGQPGSDDYTTIYDPPIPDFTLAKIEVPLTAKSYVFPPMDSASIILAIRGRGVAKIQDFKDDIDMKIRRGSILFLSANESLELELSGEDEPLGCLFFRAYCNL